EGLGGMGGLPIEDPLDGFLGGTPLCRKDGGPHPLVAAGGKGGPLPVNAVGKTLMQVNPPTIGYCAGGDGNALQPRTRRGSQLRDLAESGFSLAALVSRSRRRSDNAFQRGVDSQQVLQGNQIKIGSVIGVLLIFVAGIHTPAAIIRLGLLPVNP